jgi:hypothetical protein
MVSPVSGVSVCGAVWRILSSASLRSSALKCSASIFYNFFFCQYRAALFLRKKPHANGKTRGKIPVSQVDHELDQKIPFNPDWIGVYLDFVAFWIRALGFLLKKYGKRALPWVRDFLDSMGGLYAFAGGVYGKNLSTTRRPFYIRRPRFLLIHLFDPHLMCIPSLHVMVVIRTYTKFAAILGSLGPSEGDSDRIAGVKQGAQDITEAILYVKQHSVNCVAAAMYAMSRFDEALFPREEAGDFLAGLFSADRQRVPVSGKRGRVSAEDGVLIRNHIGGLYARFLAELPAKLPAEAPSWEKPLLDFLQKDVPEA